MNGVDPWPAGYAEILRRYADSSRPAVELGAEVSFADLGVNSMGFLGVLADLEELVGVEADLEALTPEAFASPAGLLAWVSADGSGQEPAATDPSTDADADDGIGTAADWAPVLPSKQIVFGQGHGAAVTSPADLVVRAYFLTGELDVDRLLSCIARLRAANDALRLTFRNRHGTGWAAPRRPVPGRLPVGFEQLEHWHEAELLPYVRLLTRRVAREWDSQVEGSARWMLLRLNPARHLLVTWYAHVAVDLRSVSELERQLWAGYYENEDPPERGPSYLDCLRRRQEARDRCRPAHWERESARVAAQPWDPAALTPTREHRRRLSLAEVTGIRAGGDERLSLPQILAHRFAAGVRTATGAPAVVLHLSVDERTAAEQDVAGALSGLVPVVLEDADLVSPLTATRRMVRALASRPTRPGEELPPGYVHLLTATRGYSFTYVPVPASSVLPGYARELPELPVPLDIRDPARARLRAVEFGDEGVELVLTVHPDETPDEQARELLAGIAAAGAPAGQR